MKSLIVYYIGGKWYGEDVSWKRSGSGTYLEISRIEVPQSKEAILKFAAENRYEIEWRGEFPAERQSA
jgi:pSer/pThr/pTyr-binding forkhead associated (FHA) protein